MKKFYALLKARNLEFFRDRGTLAWNLVFPFLIIFGFYFLFSGAGSEMYKVGVFSTGQIISQQKTDNFLKSQFIDFIPVFDLDEAVIKVSRHKLDMVLDITGIPRYWINNSNPKGYFLERVLWGSEVESSFRKILIEGRQIRYVDWLLPGVLAMNVMFSCLFGVGYVIVRYRKGGILRRLKAAPINAVQFLSAQVVSRLIIVMIITSILYIGSDIFLDFYVLGSLLDLFVVFLLGSFCMITLGLLVASYTHSQELAGGLLNFLTWPMMLLSEIWFSLEGKNIWLQRFAQIFPLTQLLKAARKISIDGLSLLGVLPQILALTGMSLVFLLLAAFLFRWE